MSHLFKQATHQTRLSATTVHIPVHMQWATRDPQRQQSFSSAKLAVLCITEMWILFFLISES